MSALLNFIMELLNPLALLWLILIAGTVAHLLRRRWKRGALWFGLTFVLTLFTCTAFPSVLVYTLERQFPSVPPSSLPNCDAIVCLGGASEPSLHEPAGFHLEMAADRITAALTVAKCGKAPQLILGGGGFYDGHEWLSEADALKQWIDQGSYSPIPVVSLGPCANTHDESLHVAQLFHEHGWKQVILITSASHLRRAVDTFRKSGVNVIPCPANYVSGMMRIEHFEWFHLPNATGFSIFDIWWHEVIGWRVYHWRGWI